MFFLTYLRRELWRRRRQAVVMASGLALGVGLVVTVTALTSGVRSAQGKVLQAIYGVGTDITVTTPTTRHPGNFNQGPTPEPYTQHVDNVESLVSDPIAAAKVRAVARLRGVAAATGDLVLTDSQDTIPANSPPDFPPVLISVVGVDLSGADLGPFSAGKIVAGRSFAASQARASVAVVDSAYAAQHGLRVGSTMTLGGASFSVIGVMRQSQQSNPPEVYIPLRRAQDLAKLDGDVNTILVEAGSATEVSAVSAEIAKVMPSATVTTASSLAKQVTGALSTAATLVSSLGLWLAILLLAGALAIASLMTMAAVSRRAREFGTLKALGWRSRQIIRQVVGESIVIGLLGGALGIALGVAGALGVSAAAPRLPATVVTANTGSGGFGGNLGAGGGFFSGQVGGPVATISNPSATHTVSIPFTAPISLELLLLAVALALLGGIIAGVFGGWQIGRLRPAAAMARPE